MVPKETWCGHLSSASTPFSKGKYLPLTRVYICFLIRDFTKFNQTKGLHNLVWNLQVLSLGSNFVGNSKLALQFLHEHTNGKLRFQRGFLLAYSCVCWKLVLVVEMAWN